MYVFGKDVAHEMINSNKKINKAFIFKNLKDRDIIDELKRNNIKIEFCDKDILNKMSKDGVHQGIILDIENFKYSSIDELNKDNSIVVILDHIEDPHNFGAIIRTCEAAGVNGIIIPKDRSVEVNSTVVKVSTGTCDKVNIVQVTNLSNTIKYLKDNGFWIVGTDMIGEDYREIDYNGKIGIVIGNEGKGMSRIVRESCDFIATIPMKGTVNSLNASVAAGIVIFEVSLSRK